MGEGNEHLVDDLLAAEAKLAAQNMTKVLDHGYVIYRDHMGSDQSIVNAARISYGSVGRTDEDDKKLLMRLYRDMHTSPFEMGKIVFQIKLPIFVMRQFVRHRMQNLNEVSARYKQLPNEFYIPTEWRKQSKTDKQKTDKSDCKISLPYKRVITDMDGTEFMSDDPSTILNQHCSNAYVLYNEMLAAGIGREMARMVLPVNIYTEIVCCWDMKNLLHFIRLREDAHAQAEIQDYARAMKVIARARFPWTMEAYDRYPMVSFDRMTDRIEKV